MVQISLGLNLSPQAVCELAQQGYHIISSPHAGNMRKLTITTRLMGGTPILFTGNQSEADTLSLPEYIIKGGEKFPVSKQEGRKIMSPYLVFDKDVAWKHHVLKGVVNSFRGKESLQHIHLETQERLLGEKIMLEGEFLSYDFVSLFYEVVLKHEREIFPSGHLFDRFCDSFGTITNSANSNNKNIGGFVGFKQEHARCIREGFIPDNESFLPNNIASVLLDVITSYFLSGHQKNNQNDTVYIVSGVSMYDYVKNYESQEIMKRAYGFLIQSELFSWLPKEMNVVFIPGSYLNFLPLQSEKKTALSVQAMADIAVNYPNNKTMITAAAALKNSFHEARNSQRCLTAYEKDSRACLDTFRCIKSLKFETIKKLFI